MRTVTKSTDGYKPSHWLFTDPTFQDAYAHLISRGGLYGDMTVFGLQAYVNKYLCGRVITPEEVERDNRFYTRYYRKSGVFNYQGWMYIAKNLEGRLPLEIFALPEGMIVPVQTPMLAYHVTDKNCEWLTGHLEPRLFKVWYPSMVSTISQHCKRVLLEGLKESGTEANIMHMLTDFGYRGASSEEAAEVGAAAHLVHFNSTDTIVGIDHVNEFYGDGEVDSYGDPTYMPGFGAIATKHFVMTQGGREYEPEVVRNVLKVCPDGLVVMVGDSYDIFHFCEKILGEQFHTEVVAHEGIIGVRPDSGDPIPTMLKVMWILGEKFGWTQHPTKPKYRLLNHLRTLQGDKNNYNNIYNMIRALHGVGWSLDNILTFGMGGELLQGSTRDTQKMKMAGSSITDGNGLWRAINKDPVTDPGKFSKPGRFAVVVENGKVVTKTLVQGQPIPSGNLLEVVYRNGDWLKHTTFETVRERANRWIK